MTMEIKPWPKPLSTDEPANREPSQFYYFHSIPIRDDNNKFNYNTVVFREWKYYFHTYVQMQNNIIFGIR